MRSARSRQAATIMSENKTKGYRPRHFVELSRLLESLTGIHLLETEKNTFLMAAKISPILRRRGIRSYGDYMELLNGELHSGDLGAVSEFVAALAVHTTDFFREKCHFDILSEVLREILTHSAAQKDLRIWSAATSTCQEAYSIAMTLMELPMESPARILATDLSREILEKGCQGIYSESETVSVPGHLRQKYFDAVRTKEGRFYQVRKEIHSRIQFAPLNLLEPMFPFLFHFDVIFCRNVLIYFSKETTDEVLLKLEHVMAPGAYLFLGHSEGGMVRSPGLQPIGNAVFRKVSCD